MSERRKSEAKTKTNIWRNWKERVLKCYKINPDFFDCCPLKLRREVNWKKATLKDIRNMSKLLQIKGNSATSGRAPKGFNIEISS